MKITTHDYTLPAYWVSALVNGDTTGMEDAEEQEMNAWLDAEKPGYCVGCSDEPEFRHRNDANNLGGDTLIFTFTPN